MSSNIELLEVPTATSATRTSAATATIPASRYGASELKQFIPQATFRGFTAAIVSASLLLGGYAGFLASSSMSKAKGPAINKMRLTQLPPPPAQNEAPPPPPTTAPGPAARAGTPVPVPDALIAPDVKDFANVDEISRASTVGGSGEDSGYLGLASDVTEEVRDGEPDAYEFMAVDKEPYIDLAELQKRVVYPDIARRAGIEGTVNIRVLIDKKGNPKKYIIESTDSDLLNKAAIDAVMASRFTPAIQGTTPLDCWVSIPMNFRMK
ncbi:MAG: energy transducer TonB [Candidatus Kapabacteria bacterium]|jgi:TonB family protein|nr:energy transducer TonB [Candidatus Kapabacteria bacterium]